MTPTASIELRPSKKTRFNRVAIPSIATVLCGFLWFAAARQPELLAVRDRFAVAGVVALLLTVWALAALRRRFVVGTDGVSSATAFRTQRVAWSDVDGVAHGRLQSAVTATVGGRRVRLPFSAKSSEEETAVVEAVLAHAPQLEALAWGLGLLGVERPVEDPRAPKLLPRSIECFDERVEIHGPGSTLLRLDPTTPGYEWRVECARERLARMMLGEEV